MFRRAAAPTKVPTDTVIPFRFFDDTPLWRSFILYSMFAFDDVLDPERLRGSLEDLARRDGWQKIGARLRRTANGGLEYHVPATFTKERPAITYSHITHDCPSTAHPVASRLPKPSTTPATVCDPDDFGSLFHREGAPTELNHYLDADIPQIGLHIVSFTDKTLVTLYWPHTLMDALGKQAFLRAWTSILNSRAHEVIPPVAADTDPFSELGKHPTEPHKLAAQRMSMLQLVGYGFGTVSNFLSTKENRMVCVPAAFVRKLHREAYADLTDDRAERSSVTSTEGQTSPSISSVDDTLSASVSSSDGSLSLTSSISSKDTKPSSVASDDGRPFLTDGDVLCAWWTKLAVSHLPANSKRTVCLNNAYSLRSPLAEDLLSSEHPYVSNAVAFVNVLMPVADIASKPLGHVASTIRQSIKELGTRAQVEAFTSMWRESSAKLPPFFGDSGMHMLTYSNWSKARLFETDFSGAVISAGPTDGNRKPGRPSYIQNNQFGLCLPNGFPIIGKDSGGNYWLSGYMNKGQWGQIEKQLAQMSV
ncbi:lysR family regulatory protein [Seiridium cupressi]